MPRIPWSDVWKKWEKAYSWVKRTTIYCVTSAEQIGNDCKTSVTLCLTYELKANIGLEKVGFHRIQCFTFTCIFGNIYFFNYLLFVTFLVKNQTKMIKNKHKFNSIQYNLYIKVNDSIWYDRHLGWMDKQILEIKQ